MAQSYSDEDFDPEITYELENECATPVVNDPNNGGTGTQGPPGPTGPQGPAGPPGTSCPLYCDTGSPEGVYTSPIGGLYEQTDAVPDSHSLWVKRTGTGNTGWHAWAGLRGRSGSDDSIAIGDGATSPGPTSVSIGDGSSAEGDHSLALGAETFATQDFATAVGNGGIASALYAVAIGTDAQASAEDAIAIGRNTVASGARAEAFGYNSVASAADAKAMGSGAQALAAASIAIGKDAYVNTADSIAIGNAARADEINSIVVGNGNTAGDEEINIGFNNVNFNDSVTPSAFNKNFRATLIGHDISLSSRSTYGVIVIGQAAYMQNEGFFADIIIGSDAGSGDTANASGGGDVVIGQNAHSNWTNDGYENVVIGYNAAAEGDCTVALGHDSEIDNADFCVALGPHAYVGADGGISIGRFATVSGGAKESIVIGQNAVAGANHYNAMVFGSDADSAGPGLVMFGAPAVDKQVRGICFNGSATPAIIVNPDGTIEVFSNASNTVTPTYIYTTNTTFSNANRIGLGDATGGNITFTMPAPGTVPNGAVFYFRKYDSSANTVTVVPNAGTFGGTGGPYASIVLSAQYDETWIWRNPSNGNWETWPI